MYASAPTNPLGYKLVVKRIRRQIEFILPQ